MSFDLQVQLSGLLHYIPNVDTSQRVRLCIVLPEADNHHTLISARGSSRLRLRGQFVGSPDFDGKRVVFRFTRLGTTASGPFDYETPMLSRDVKGVVPFNMIAGDEANENPKVASDQATKADGVRSQILLEEGVFFLPPGEPAEFDLPGDITGHVTPIKLSQKVFMRVKDLDSVEIHVSNLDGSGSTEVYSIQPDATNKAELLVGYLCPDLPLGTPDPTVDEDFKFHYKLLDRDNAASTEAAEPLPIIRHLPPIAAGPTLRLRRRPNILQPLVVTAGGCDCAGWGGKALPLNLDSFLPDMDTPALRLNPSDLQSPWSTPPM